VRIAVAGCGSIGSRHLRNLAALGCDDLVAVDPDRERLDRLAAETGARAAADFTGADAVLVTAPPALHLELAEQALAAGAHLFVEKPLAHSLDGVEDFVRRFEASGLVGLVGMNWKFHPAFVSLKERLAEIGPVFSARLEFGQYLPDWHPWEDYRGGYSARRDLGGGILLDAHEFEYARWLLGPVDAAFGLVDRTGLLETETEDAVSALLRFASGAQGEVHVDYLQRRYRRTIAIHGAEGSLTWDADGDAGDVNEMYMAEMRHFLACLAGEEEPRTTLRDAYEALLIGEAVRRSAGSGRLEAVR
jgi:predicted dehydrogenase